MSKLKLFSTSLIAIIACLSISANAKPMVCPFTDHFTVRVPDGYKIQNHSIDGSLAYTQQNDIEFMLQCGDGGNTESGKVNINVGNAINQCTLEIEDGPTYWNPVINVLTCTRPSEFRYVNTEHRFGSYEYTIVFG